MSKWTDKESIFAELFHVILRKSLDSTASSICWNAIHILEPDAWYSFVHTASKLEKVNKKDCMDAVDFGRPDRNLFRIGLEMLTDEEYDIIDERIKEMA